GSASSPAQTFAVNVLEAPMVFTSGTTASVTEADSGTTPLYTAVATDPAGEAVSYSLSDDAGGAFRIDSSTGAVTVADASKLLDATTLSFTVQAAEADDADGASTQTVVVTVNDAPLSFTSGTTARVTEGDPGSTAIYTAVATDPAGEKVGYFLSDNGGGA